MNNYNFYPSLEIASFAETPEEVEVLRNQIDIYKDNNSFSKVLNKLENCDIRGLIDNRNETISKKIRDAEINKYPFMFIVGDRELKEETGLKVNQIRHFKNYSNPDRDPRTLIDKSIREIAAEMVTGRLYTRRI